MLASSSRAPGRANLFATITDQDLPEQAVP
jgi:hypothetical protein